MPPIRKFDPERAKKAAEQVDALWAEVAAEGMEQYRASLEKDDATGERLWNDRTVRDVRVGQIAALVGADKRAKRMSEAPRVSALILMQARIESAPEWEKFAAEQAVAAERERNAIDAIHTEAIQRGPGAVGELPEQLGSDVREGSK